MKRRAVVSLDVGGTNIDAACVSLDGDIVGGIKSIGSPSTDPADEALQKFADLINDVRGSAGDCDILAVGIGMPGPFDYQNGISRMEHKFAALNGVNVAKGIEERTGLPVYFVNDAAAFGLGVSWHQLPNARRIVGITIGTGLGSSFIEDGQNIEHDDRVPPDGEMWNIPYKDGILEDAVSGRAAVNNYQRLSGKKLGAKEIEDLVRQGDSEAVAAYKEMGEALGDVLADISIKFDPEKIVVGGKIGRALDIFGPVAQQKITEKTSRSIDVVQAAGENLALFSAAKHAIDQLSSAGL